jgi:hypothetical protein
MIEVMVTMTSQQEQSYPVDEDFWTFAIALNDPIAAFSLKTPTWQARSHRWACFDPSSIL